jgi:penicillin-binding protein 1C
LLLRLLGRAGLTTFDKTAAHYGLGVTLGNAEVRLDQLVAAYAAFARNGLWIEPSAVRRSPNAIVKTQQLVSPRTAFWITDILSDAEAREFIFGRGGSLDLPFPVAVKTGTSQAYHDNWTIGYSRRVAVGVWVGNFDRTPLRNSSGVTGAGPIFNAVMLAAERRLGGAAIFSADPILATPGNVVEREICALSGMTANAWCPIRRREWVAAESSSLTCSWHHHGDEGLLTFWPAEYRQWAHANGLDHSDRVAPPWREQRITTLRSASKDNGQASIPHASLTIVSPPDGATYLIDPTLRREFQTLPLRAASDSRGSIEWSVAEKVIGSADANKALDWPLIPGEHRIVARDAQGHTAEATVVVR